MSVSNSGQDKVAGAPKSRPLAPNRAIGWWTIGLSVLGLAVWVILPMITITFRERYPVTDTWVMPAIGLLLTDTAAVFNMLCLWFWKERSVLNILFAVLVIPVSLFVTFMVVGEGLAG